MRQLSSLDAQFLALEDARQTGHVAGLMILDASRRTDGPLALGDIIGLLEQRLHLLPPLRQRLATVPLGLDYPYWVEDPDFDLEFHVRELGLPAPGTDHQLAEQAARIVSRPLDRQRPLWELYLISGLDSGHVALLTKIHHAVVDGMSGAEIMGLLLDLEPAGRELPPPAGGARARRAPGSLEMLARGLIGIPRYPLRVLRALPSAVPNLDETSFATIPGAGLLSRAARLIPGVGADGDQGVRHALKAPKTTFSGPISAHRRFAFGQLPLERIKAAKNIHGGTVNDVVVALCAGAVRRWLIEHDELPDIPLVAQIPVSVRTPEQAGTFGNRILMLGVPLFTTEADPVTRLQRTSEALLEMKEQHRALPAELLQDVNHFIPPAVFSRAARLSFALNTSAAGRPAWNLVISNVPGPQFDLYCAGARLVANYPISVITHGMGLNITVMSYCGSMDIGVVADRGQISDVWPFLEWMGKELDELGV
ncbi:MAG TPA: wax ester/triacylglycerol synthase family O-acyltransferase [Mycobacteriales bacterium]|nr:wax ester/triacylglycerol synthase family O-acyltransferase [Mycobacteriales bacterium]